MRQLLKASETEILLPRESSEGNGQPPGDVLRFAAQLRKGVRGATSDIFLMTPVSKSHSALGLGLETARILAKMNETPVLVIDLENRGDDRLLHGSETPLAQRNGSGNGEEGFPKRFPDKRELPTITVLRPLTEGADAAAVLTSQEFTEFLSRARSIFSLVLVAAKSALESVETLLVAAACDQTILLVRDGETSMADLQEVKRSLRRVQAGILGFVYEKR